MALTERSRSTLFQGLSRLLDDDQAVAEMLSYFPARDVEEPVTKDFLRAEMADLRAEMADLRSEMTELRTDFRVELQSALRSQTQWLVGLMVSLAAVVTGVIALTS